MNICIYMYVFVYMCICNCALQRAQLQLQLQSQLQGVVRDLGEMGSAQGKGAREGQAPLTTGEISILVPARKEATWSRRKKERRARHDEEDPACTE